MTSITLTEPATYQVRHFDQDGEVAHVETVDAIATFRDSHGGEMHIRLEDGAYTVDIKRHRPVGMGRDYAWVTHIGAEIQTILARLPPPSAERPLAELRACIYGAPPSTVRPFTVEELADIRERAEALAARLELPIAQRAAHELLGIAADQLHAFARRQAYETLSRVPSEVYSQLFPETPPPPHPPEPPPLPPPPEPPAAPREEPRTGRTWESHAERDCAIADYTGALTLLDNLRERYANGKYWRTETFLSIAEHYIETFRPDDPDLLVFTFSDGRRGRFSCDRRGRWTMRYEDEPDAAPLALRTLPADTKKELLHALPDWLERVLTACAPHVPQEA